MKLPLSNVLPVPTEERVQTELRSCRDAGKGLQAAGPTHGRAT